MNKKTVFTIVALILFSCAGLSAREFTLSGSDGSPCVEYTTQDNVKITLGGVPFPDEKLIRYVVEIKNEGTELFNFSQENLKVFHGNCDSSEWTPSRYYSADQYYQKKRIYYESDIDAGDIFLGALATIAVVDALVNWPRRPVTAFDNHHHGYHHHHHHRGPRHHYYKSRPLSSAVKLMIHAQIASSIIKAIKDTDFTPDHLKDVLLFDKVVEPGETYTGYFMAKPEYAPDYKICITSNEEEASFVFKRSDREEILHPFCDPLSDRSTMFFGFPFNSKSCGVEIGYIYQTKGLGFYAKTDFLFNGNTNVNTEAGLVNNHCAKIKESSALYQNFQSTTIDFTDYGEIGFLSYGFSTGFTVKTFPHTWLLMGCGVMGETIYHYGHLENENYAMDTYATKLINYPYVCPEIGFSCIFDPINFGGTFSWNLGSSHNSGPRGSIFVGLSL